MRCLTRARSTGITSSSNHGFFFSQILLRGLGWGIGKTVGQWSAQALTVSVSVLDATAGRCQSSAYCPITNVSSSPGICAINRERQCFAHSGLGGKSPERPVPGKQKPIGRIETVPGSWKTLERSTPIHSQRSPLASSNGRLRRRSASRHCFSCAGGFSREK